MILFWIMISKQKFYSGSSNVISHMIDNYSEHSEKKSDESQAIGYGNIALNRSVKTIKSIDKKIKSGLDAFLRK